MLKLFCFCLLIFCFFKIAAQNNLTFLNDNYSGINSAVLSPTQPFFNQHPWDINLVSADVFLQNDYAYISKQSLLGLAGTPIESANPKKISQEKIKPTFLIFTTKEKLTFWLPRIFWDLHFL